MLWLVVQSGFASPEKGDRQHTGFLSFLSCIVPCLRAPVDPFFAEQVPTVDAMFVKTFEETFFEAVADDMSADMEADIPADMEVDMAVEAEPADNPKPCQVSLDFKTYVDITRDELLKKAKQVINNGQFELAGDRDIENPISTIMTIELKESSDDPLADLPYDRDMAYLAYSQSSGRYFLSCFVYIKLNLFSIAIPSGVDCPDAAKKKVGHILGKVILTDTLFDGRVLLTGPLRSPLNKKQKRGLGLIKKGHYYDGVAAVMPVENVTIDWRAAHGNMMLLGKPMEFFVNDKRIISTNDGAFSP